MAANHLLGNYPGDIVEIEVTGLFGHPGVKHHLEQQVSEFVAQMLHVVASDRIGDFVGFLDRVRCDRREVLLGVPGTARLRIAKLLHYFK